MKMGMGIGTRTGTNRQALRALQAACQNFVIRIRLVAAEPSVRHPTSFFGLSPNQVEPHGTIEQKWTEIGDGASTVPTFTAALPSSPKTYFVFDHSGTRRYIPLGVSSN